METIKKNSIIGITIFDYPGKFGEDINFFKVLKKTRKKIVLAELDSPDQIWEFEPRELDFDDEYCILDAPPIILNGNINSQTVKTLYGRE